MLNLVVYAEHIPIIIFYYYVSKTRRVVWIVRTEDC